MTQEYDREFGGKIRTYRSLEAKANIQEKFGECRAYSDLLARQRQALEYINQSIDNKILASGQEA